MTNVGEPSAIEGTEKSKRVFIMKSIARAFKKALSLNPYDHDQTPPKYRPTYRGSLDKNLRGRRYVRLHDSGTLELEALNLQCAAANSNQAAEGKAAKLATTGSESKSKMEKKQPKLGTRAECGRKLILCCAALPEDSML